MMSTQWFADLARALASSDLPSVSEPPAELELLTDSCVVRAAPIEDGAALGITVRYVSDEDDGLFNSVEALQLHIRLHQGGGVADDWRFALTDDNAPMFVRRLPAEEVDAARFEALMQQAIDHAELARDLAHRLRQPQQEDDPASRFVHLRA